jgi:hypothetical protein
MRIRVGQEHRLPVTVAIRFRTRRQSAVATARTRWSAKDGLRTGKL